MNILPSKSLVEDLVLFRDRLGMFVVKPDDFDCVAAFLAGYDLASQGNLFSGFQHWGRICKWREETSFWVPYEVKFAVEKQQNLEPSEPISYLLEALLEYHQQKEVTS